MATVRVPNVGQTYDPRTINDIARAIQSLAAHVPDFPIQEYTLTNVTQSRTMDADTITLAELADIVGTLLQDLKNTGAIR